MCGLFAISYYTGDVAAFEVQGTAHTEIDRLLRIE